MFLSMNWISDFVDFTGLDKVELIHRFSLSTAEVENEIFFKGSDISGIVVAEIKSVENHPDSKKLHLLKVDAGDGQLTDVVCLISYYACKLFSVGAILCIFAQSRFELVELIRHTDIIVCIREVCKRCFYLAHYRRLLVIFTYIAVSVSVAFVKICVSCLAYAACKYALA